MTISAAKMSETIQGGARHDKDTGSPEVQVSILTERITSLQDHFRVHAKDHASRRGLLLMVGQRNRLLKYLARTDRSVYQDLIKRLGLRK
ncbi:MAG: 30S ribosomal protein S15 [Phycisphaerales bacterium]|nr:30S ribosomal protein S15 [Phycisphaerales bacterium]